MGPGRCSAARACEGIVNVDVSPELAVRLAKAWASSFEKGSVITTSRDTSRAARVLKRALMVGCNSVGVNVTDLEVATIPVTRHHIRTRGTQGGLTVRLSPDDPQSVAIRFFDSHGLDLSENEQRRIERLYHREEFRRVTAGDIGDIDFSPRAIEHYTADVVEAFDLPHASRRELKLVLDLSYGAASFVMPNLLSKVQADVLSINPYAQTPGMISVDPATSAARVVRSVRSSGADLGAVIDAGGEHLTLVDGTGPRAEQRRGAHGLLRAGDRGAEWRQRRPGEAGARGPAADGQPEGAPSCAQPVAPRCSPPPCRPPS